jgi:hypothetical protein
VVVYAVVDDALSADFPLGDSLEVFIRREDAERFIEEVRGDDPEVAAQLRIEDRVGSRSANALDDLDQLVQAVTVLATELDELACLHHDDTALGSSRHRDATTATELEKSFAPKELQGTQQGVLVHAEDGGKILGRRQALARLGLTVRNCSP